jgi:hypothetical protein
MIVERIATEAILDVEKNKRFNQLNISEAKQQIKSTNL